ncbi:MAG: GerMN domain-containing protein [Oscillospiraceae bacterium]|nr:GerMN domain-containing protein [Oscillospiraceae bacterium]
MKRMIAAFLLLALLTGLTACANKKDSIQEPVAFYYRRADITYGSSDSVILSEFADAADCNGDTTLLLKQYLKGPQSETLAQTFPVGTTVLSLTVEENTADILLSSQFARLSGIDLTIACACLTLTALKLTGTETVVIHAHHNTLNGMEQIVMDKNCILLLDDGANSAD